MPRLRAFSHQTLALESQGWQVHEAENVAAITAWGPRPDAIVLEASTPLKGLASEDAPRRARGALGVPHRPRRR